MKAASKVVTAIRAHRELVWILVQRNIRIRYKGSALGFLWSLASPVFFILIYGTFIRMITRGFAFDLRILVSGIIIWQFTALCMGDSLGAIVGNANLVKKTAFPRIILPLSTVLANFVNFMMSAAVLIVYLAVTGARFDMRLAGWLPAILLTHLALCLGLSFIVSAVNVYFRDAEHILTHITTAWFFLTPVIYSPALPLGMIEARLPAAVKWLYFANPMAGILAAYRRILLSEDAGEALYLLVSAVVAWAILGAGIRVFQRMQGRFADEL